MIPTLQPSQQLQLKYIFGLNSMIRNNIYFIDETRIIYPAGYQIVCYSLQDKGQTYFQGVEGYKGYSCIALSPMRRFLAAGVKGEKPAILIYDTMSQKRKRTLLFNEAPVKEWYSLAFAPTAEAKTLISLSGGAQSEAYLCYWQIDTSKCIAFIKVALNVQDIFEVSFHPDDNTLIACIGKQVFKFFRFSVIEGESKTLKCTSNILNKAPAELSQNYTCHAWMHNPNHLIVCTSIGEIFQCDDNGDFERMIEVIKQPFSIEVIQPLQHGFICGGDNQTLFIYSGDYKLLHTLTVGSSENKISVRGLSLTPLTEETIIVTLSTNLIYSLKMGQFDEQNQFELVSLPFHSMPNAGIQNQKQNEQIPINGMDICIRKPLIVTCGSDKCIRVWNYEEKIIEAYKVFSDEAYCVSIHPSGFHLVVGLSDKLRLMTICVHNNQIKPYKEIVPFKACREIKFSNGGQYFAAANQTGSNQQHVIHVYKFYTGENPPQLIFKGHQNKIRCLAWSKDDTILASCGVDGMICTFRVAADSNGSRTVDIHAKGIQFSSVTMTIDSKTLFSVGNDKILREISIQDGTEIKRNVDIILSQIAFPSSNKILFAGVSDERHSGAIRCYKYPFTGAQGGQYNEYQAHDERGLDKMRVTADDQFLITTGRDGVIIIYEIKDKDARGMKLKEGYSKPSDEILVTRQDLDDLKANKELNKTAISDFSNPTQNNYNIPQMEEKIKQLNEEIQKSKQEMTQRYQTLEQQYNENKKKFDEEIKSLKDKYEQEIQDLDQNQQVKVNNEANKFEKTKTEKENELNRYQKDVSKLQYEHQEEIRSLNKKSDERVQDEKLQRERLQKEFNENLRKYQSTIDQTEKEIKSEIESLKKQNEEQILDKTEQGLKAKSEVSMNKKKIEQQKQDVEKLVEEIKEFEEQKKQLVDSNNILKQAIEEQLKQITERDKTIGEKERKIYELKKRSQELEKYKFVLDHKIKELKRDIGPREDEINRMKEQTNKMDQKLKGFAQLNNYLGNVVDKLDSDQKQMKEKIKSQRQVISFQNVRIKKFKDLVYQAVQYIQNYEELKNKAYDIFKEFLKKDVKPQEVNQDIMAEYKSQKEYLEKSVEGLKANLQTDEEIHKAENIRIMRGNVKLISEINKLRKKKKEIKQTHSTKDQKKEIIISQGPINEKLETKKKILNEQKDEKDRLKEELLQLEQELDILN